MSVKMYADGGRLRYSRIAGPFLVTLFTTPEPLTPGPADLSVMVQEAQTGEVLSDARVKMRLTQAGGKRQEIDVTAERGVATNRLLQAAEFDIPASGPWVLRVEVSEGARTASVDSVLPVEEGSRNAPVIWTFGLLPAVAVFLFVLHQRQKALLSTRQSHGQVARSG